MNAHWYVWPGLKFAISPGTSFPTVVGFASVWSWRVYLPAAVADTDRFPVVVPRSMSVSAFDRTCPHPLTWLLAFGVGPAAPVALLIWNRRVPPPFRSMLPTVAAPGLFPGWKTPPFCPTGDVTYVPLP